MPPNLNHKRSREAAARRERAIEAVGRAGRKGTLEEVLGAEGIGIATYHRWRDTYPDFGPRFDEARRRYQVGGRGYDGSFVSFRLAYLGMDTTWFQAQIAEAIESAKPGEVVLVLIPPEHGKTTLLEDWCTHKLVKDPSFRITVASETVDHGEKIVTRVRERLEPDGPTPKVVEDFGPFAPDNNRSSQVWSQRRFNVAGKKTSDERDYSMNCVGITGRVQGTRCDLLLLDDMQDIKSLDLSEKYYTIVTQSFLSRPSMFGRTVIIGTRVGEYDVYRKLIEAQIPDRIIEIPAYKISESPPWPAPKEKPSLDRPETWAPEGTKFLWPDKYDQIEEGGGRQPGLHRFRYAALRFRVGEQTWWRIYMQRPEAASSMTFDSETTRAMYDEQRSVIADPRPLNHRDSPDIVANMPVPIIIAVDPAVGGGNGVLAVACRPKRMEVLSAHLDYGLTKYSQIIQLIEEDCHRYSTPDSVVALVVVEDKAFQKGLLEDDRMLTLQEHFGFRLVPNNTNREKTDKDIGVPAMPMAMIRREITIPWADDASRKAMWHLLDQLGQWRPGVNGVVLPQDLVMCLWFAYRKWRGMRETPAYMGPVNPEGWHTERSPLRQPRRKSRNRRVAWR